MSSIEDKDIAIIGSSFRLPEAKTDQELESLIYEGKKTSKIFTYEELIDSGIDKNLALNKNYVPVTCFLDGVDKFDAEFFGFSNREAEVMDPQYRLFFECAYEAMEIAGVCQDDKFNPLRVGTFATSGMALYSCRLMNNYFHNNVKTHSRVLDNFDPLQIVFLNDKDWLTTQLSYRLNLKGPSYSVQSACSSSLVALHLAIKSLRSNECDIAIVGASAIHSPLKSGYLYSEGSIFSPNGNCVPFSNEANGIIGGNGVSVIILKRLKESVECNDNILAVIKGSAINNDGSRKVSFTAPSIEGQKENIIAALQDANLNALDIDYVEAHGTATQLGDTIEIAAFTQAFECYTKQKQFCQIGSFKSNIGHLDTAAGMASIIKSLSILKNKLIPPIAGYKVVNPLIDLSKSPFIINAHTTPMKKLNRPATILVASLGAGGTNAHVILQEWKKVKKRKTSNNIDISINYNEDLFLPISAKNQNALSDYAKIYLSYLDSTENDIKDICYTAGTGRTHYKHRICLVGDTKESLKDLLSKYINENKNNFGVEKIQSLEQHSGLVFVFAGQGTQVSGMGRELFELHPVYKEAVEKCKNFFYAVTGKDLSRLLFKASEDELSLTENTQPALFAYQYGLYEVFKSIGVIPSAVIGHSSGEYLAAYVAGMLSFEDAFTLLIKRSIYMGELPKGGGMLAVFAKETIVLEILKENELDLTISVQNSAEALVLSGCFEAVEKAGNVFKRKEIYCQKLNVSHAFHSEFMRPAAVKLENAAKNVKISPAKIPIVSNVTGKFLKIKDVTPSYWGQHLLNQVRFHDGIKFLIEQNYQLFLEIGPKSVLTKFITQGFPNVFAISSQVQKYEIISLNQAIAKLYTKGIEIDWYSLLKNRNYNKIRLPTYPFQRKKYWLQHTNPNFGLEQSRGEIREDNIIYIQDWIESKMEKRFFEEIEKESFILICDSSNSIAQYFMRVFNEQKFFNSIIIDELKLKDNLLLTDMLRNIIRENINKKQWNIVYMPNQENGAVSTLSNSLVLLQVMQALSNEIKFHQLTIITFGAQYVEKIDQNISCESSTVWGFIRTAQLEFNEFKIFISDLDINEVENSTKNYLLDVLNINRQNQIVYRGNKRFVLKITTLEKIHNNKNFVQSNGCYLITGAFGGIGIFLANYLIKSGSNHLILVGRNKPKSDYEEVIKNWKKTNIKIDLIICDITNEKEFHLRLAEIIQSRKINGVFHLAGILEDKTICQMDPTSIEKVLKPKVEGVKALWASIKIFRPEFIVLFSSISEAVGSLGQANYAGANSYLNAFARNLKLSGVNAYSISWGPWKDVGMFAKTKHINNLKYFAIPVSAEEYFVSLNVIINGDCVCPIVAKLSNPEDFYSKIETFEDQEKKEKIFSIEAIKQQLKYEVSELLGKNSKDIGESTLFIELGVDSLMSILLTKKINTLYELSLSAVNLYNFPTIAKIACKIEEEFNKLNPLAEGNNFSKLTSNKFDGNTKIDEMGSDNINLLCEILNEIDLFE